MEDIQQIATRVFLKKGYYLFMNLVAFQQNNGKIHVSIRARAWFEEHGIWVIKWSALKVILCRLHPGIHLLRNNNADIAQLKEWIHEAWLLVPQNLIDTLIRLMLIS